MTSTDSSLTGLKSVNQAEKPRMSSRKRRSNGNSVNVQKKQVRRCEKRGCHAARPVCFASCSIKCAGNAYTSRWYHMSSGEHFCNECFEHFYRPNKEGYPHYLTWRKKWIENSRTDTSIRAFMNDQILPYWIQCTRPSCRKWRRISESALNDSSVTVSFVKNFCCQPTMAGVSESGTSVACDVPEDTTVSEVCEFNWICQLMMAPLMKKSPAARFLVNYFPDGVGLSPTCDHCVKPQTDISNNESTSGRAVEIKVPKIEGLNPYFEPFYQPFEHGKSFCIRPDVMDSDEVEAFPEYRKEQVMYLGIRNLIIAMWNLKCEQWLTMADVASNLICRGLSRIRCMIEARRIVQFLTVKGVVNFGIIVAPHGERLLSSSNERVLVVGAGAAGLAVARQLTNYGLQVVVLEARNRIGGRVYDDEETVGVCVGRGAQIVTGVINNPISYMCKQAGVDMRVIGTNCDLYDENGEIVGMSVDFTAENHFNSMLEAVANWRKEQSEDVDLAAKLAEMHEVLVKGNDFGLGEDVNKVLQFHISNLEYACGTNLKNVSSLHWDQNESYPQFAGNHTILPSGYSVLLRKLAEGVDVKLNSQVTKIDYSRNCVTAWTANGETYNASKAVITLPLAILKRKMVEFVPDIPEKKSEAIEDLGAGIIEKVVLKFPRRFWASRIKDADFFGHIPSAENERGRFAVFYDLSKTSDRNDTNKTDNVLMTYLSGDAVDLTTEKSDKHIIDMCMNALRSIFGREDDDVPDPIGWIVTHWMTDPLSRMSYSYIRKGSDGTDYDTMAQSVDDKLFFAGEATNRQFPQTVTGAYLSGVREAGKILGSLQK